MRDIGNARIVHVLREGNMCANWLANLGQHGEWGTGILEDPPLADLERPLQADAPGGEGGKMRRIT